MRQFRQMATVANTARAGEDARRDVSRVIAGVIVAPPVALFAIGCVTYALFGQLATMPLWYPVGQLLPLTGLDGPGLNWEGLLTSLGRLASSLMVSGVVVLGGTGILLVLSDLFGPARFIPEPIVRVIVTGRFSARLIGLAIATGLVWSAHTVIQLLFAA
jgi:hypothetical protein